MYCSRKLRLLRCIHQAQPPERFMQRRTFGAAAVAMTLTAIAPSARPQPAGASGWPTKTVRILVGFPAGSSPDLAARVLSEALGKVLGQAVIVENKPGASGNIAAQQVAQAQDDH